MASRTVSVHPQLSQESGHAAAAASAAAASSEGSLRSRKRSLEEEGGHPKKPRTTILEPLECPVCMSFQPKWKVISCGHTVCTTCCAGLMGGYEGHIKCPLCRTMCAAPADCPMLNSLAEKMRETLCPCSIVSRGDTYMQWEEHTCPVEWDECTEPTCGRLVYLKSEGHRCPNAKCPSFHICGGRGREHNEVCNVAARMKNACKSARLAIPQVQRLLDSLRVAEEKIRAPRSNDELHAALAELHQAASLSHTRTYIHSLSRLTDISRRFYVEEHGQEDDNEEVQLIDS